MLDWRPVLFLSCSVSWFLHPAALFQFISFHPSVPFPVGKWHHDGPSRTTGAASPVWGLTLCLCVQVLSCLVQIASVRRSLFNNAERAKFLSHLVDGVKRILANPQVGHTPEPHTHVSCSVSCVVGRPFNDESCLCFSVCRIQTTTTSSVVCWPDWRVTTSWGSWSK